MNACQFLEQIVRPNVAEFHADNASRRDFLMRFAES
jgi:hypothetical protein